MHKHTGATTTGVRTENEKQTEEGVKMRRCLNDGGGENTPPSWCTWFDPEKLKGVVSPSNEDML